MPAAMWLRPAIVILLLALLASLLSSLVFLLRDQGGTRRTVNWLGVRLALAAMLMSLIGYGLYTGQLGSRAPWDERRGVEVSGQ